MRKVLLMAVAVFSSLALSYGQEARKLTLKDAVDIALENNLRIKRGVYNVESFKANLLQSKAAFLPTINSSGNYTNNYGRALNPVSNLYVDKNSNTINASLTGSLTLFNGLRLQNSFRQNQRDVIAANHDLQKAKNDVILNVVTLYTNVIFNQELFENAKYQLNSSQQQLDRIKKQVDAGSLSISNQFNQEAQVATNEVNAINQENALLLSILQLKQAMQVPASQQLTIEIPDLQLEDIVLDQTAEDVYQIALLNMPEVRSAQLKKESANYALKSSRGNYYPRLSLNASAQSNYSSLSNGCEAQVATNEVNAINQENALLLSILQLKQAMQVPASQQLTIEIPDLQLEDIVLDQTAEDVYQIALLNMPEVRSAQLKKESANYALKSSRGNYYPRLSLNASAQSNYSSLSNGPRSELDGTYRIASTASAVAQPGAVPGPGDVPVYAYIPNTTQVASEYGQADQLKDNLFKGLSLQVTIPILNGLQTRTNVQRALINQEIADITIKETENTLRQSIETAYNDASAASRSYAASVKQVNAQQEAYRMNKQRFDVGALSIIEYQVSENDLFRAKSDLTRAKYNFIFKKKVLDFYQGKTIEY